MAKTSIKFRLSYLDKDGRRQLIYSDESQFTIKLNGAVVNDITKLGIPLYISNCEIEQYTGSKDKRRVEIYVGDSLVSAVTPHLYHVKYGFYRISESLELSDGTIHTFNSNHIGFFVEWKDRDDEYQASVQSVAANLKIIDI